MNRKISRAKYAGGIYRDFANSETAAGTIIPFGTRLSETGPTNVNTAEINTATNLNADILNPSKNDKYKCSTDERESQEKDKTPHCCKEQAKHGKSSVYNKYCQDKLMMSNDIERQPGPKRAMLLQNIVVIHTCNNFDQNEYDQEGGRLECKESIVL